VRGEIEPFYQPIVNLLTGAVAGFEALARWRHPKRGLVPPDEFLGLADEMGLMNDLGLLMMTSASRQLAEWLGRHPSAGKLFCSVNLSVGEIERANLVEDVARIIAETGLPRGALKLEVTEGDIMRDTAQAAEVLTRLKAAGASLALDDFGTGFSSLAWLAKLPFDTLEDRPLFRSDHGQGRGSAKIVKSVVNLGRDLSPEAVPRASRTPAWPNCCSMPSATTARASATPALPAQEAESI
jgi:c-di-GMP-specific phosphodiesterase